MIRAFLLSIAQLGDRRFLAVLAKSLALTILAFALLGGAGWWLAQRGLERMLGHPAAALAGAVAAVVFVLVLWFAFRAVAMLVIGVFADEIVEAVEAKHYPTALATARPVGIARSVRMGAASAARFVAVNVVLLPVYIVLLATGVGTAALFFAVNAWLLGRDLGDMVAARHLPAGGMRAWHKATAGRRFLLGFAGTGLFVVPGVNLLAPLLGAAMATHIFHGGKA